MNKKMLALIFIIILFTGCKETCEGETSDGKGYYKKVDLSNSTSDDRYKCVEVNYEEERPQDQIKQQKS